MQGGSNVQRYGYNQKELYQNLMDTPLPYGGVTNIHLGILMTDTIYFQRTGEHFVIRVDPGSVSTFPAAATDRQREISREQQKTAKKYLKHVRRSSKRVT